MFSRLNFVNKPEVTGNQTLQGMAPAQVKWITVSRWFVPDNAATVMLWRLLKQLLIFPKGLLGGIVFATVMWTAIVSYQTWHTTSSARKLSYQGAVAISGGWQFLAQVPWVVVLLSLAFGLGFYSTVSWIARHP
jgi:hypothetical protein